MRIALAIICKGTPSEARLLNRCLENMSPYVDAIYLTFTYTDQNEVSPESYRAAKRYKAVVSEFKWIDDFAAARNFNFDQVPKDFDYIMWSDADDMWRGLPKLRATLAEHPHMDAFGFWYNYDWDEQKKPTVVHRKTMIIKNDGAARWTGALHEDLEPTRQLDVHLIDGIERCHLYSEASKDERESRNVRIAEKVIAENPNDPRNYWNLANSQFGASKYAEARINFNKFLEMSESDDEKYVAMMRLAGICKSLGDRDGAIRELRQAIGVLPSIPDAYLHLAHLYYTFGNMDKAEEYCLQGMLRKPQIHKMILYNPRDYDYNPMMLLATIYYHRNRPDLMMPLLEGCLKIYPNDKELQKRVVAGREEKTMLAQALTRVQKLQKMRSKTKLKEALDALPPELQSHPAICVLRNKNFIKEKSSGKDLAIYCSNTEHQWYEGAKGFIGGSEEAVINLSKELAEIGWNVTIYNNCGHQARKIGKVQYQPFWVWNYRDKQDAVILWRWAKPLDAEINSPVILMDLHDVVPEGEFTEKRLAKVAKIMVKSKFHRSLFPNIPDSKFAIVPNGIDLTLLSTAKIKRDPNLIINTSSPDRSLDVLPKLFMEVKKQFPSARCAHAYGWEIFDNTFRNDVKKMAWKEKVRNELKAAGIEELGRLSQKDIGEMYQKATYLAYPTEFAEIDCISVRKAQAAGCFPVTTDFGALAETVWIGDQVHSTKNKDTWAKPYQYTYGLEGETEQRDWVNMMVYRLKHPVDFDPSEWRKQFMWSQIASEWNKALCG